MESRGGNGRADRSRGEAGPPVAGGRPGEAWGSKSVEFRAIPTLLFDAPREATIRAWVPGCGSGEPAYGLAMLLIEQAEAAGRAVEVRVFATETCRATLAIAREGLYPADLDDDLPADRLRRFFARDPRGWRVGAELRRGMFFAHHDPARDLPHPRLDLIDGSHLRAGADADAREAIARSLRRGLRPGGLLVQGGSPLLIEAPDDWFEPVSGDRTVLRRTAWPHPDAPDAGPASLFIDRRSLFEDAQDAILLAGDDGRYVDANPAACALTGYSRAELLERTVLDLTPGVHREAGMALWQSFLEQGRMEGEHRLLRKDGAIVAVEYRAVARILPGLHLSIARDVAERKRLEAEVLEVASAEQRRIGQELHDDAGQILTGLGLLARVLADRLEGSPADRRIADRIVDGIGETLDRLRAVVKGLVPVEVDADGLMAALAELADRTDRLGGLACRFDCDGPVKVRDNTTAAQLYRIAQEAVTNAIRHGRPETIRIELGQAGGRILLEVRDDGRGLPAPLDEAEGRGLRIMRYRAGLIGAALSIGAAGDRGTVVRCTFIEDDRHDR